MHGRIETEKDVLRVWFYHIRRNTDFGIAVTLELNACYDDVSEGTQPRMWSYHTDLTVGEP